MLQILPFIVFNILIFTNCIQSLQQVIKIFNITFYVCSFGNGPLHLAFYLYVRLILSTDYLSANAIVVCVIAIAWIIIFICLGYRCVT